MALSENERMTTRQRRPNYLLLNNGYDDESLPEDQISESFQAELDTFTNITTSSDIMPSESISQTIASAMPTETRFHYSQKRPRSAPVTGWVWDHFQITEVNREWTVQKTRKRMSSDRDI
jgi:hypothetical protein